MYRVRVILIFLCLLAAGGAARPAMAQVRSLRAVNYAGKRYIAVKDLAAMYGLPLTEAPNKKLQIRGQYSMIDLTGDRREMIFNGIKVWLHAPVTKIRGAWHISDADARYVVDPLVRPSAYLSARGVRTVVIDAGHGGKDPGAIGTTGVQEKILALDIAKRTAAHLRAKGVRVVMTRDTDRFWELKDRPFLAARAKGDLFVSIHLNATGTRSVQGIETFVIAAENYPPTAEPRLTGKYPAVANNKFNHSSTVLGHQIQRSLIHITKADDRGLKRARFHVIKASAMPAALIECGFLSNPQEEKKIMTVSYRETLAQGISQGIIHYIGLVNRAKVELGAPLVQPMAPRMAAAPVFAPAPSVGPIATAPPLAPPAAAALPPHPIATPATAQAAPPPAIVAPVSARPPPAAAPPAQPVSAPAARVVQPASATPVAAAPVAAAAPPPASLARPPAAQPPPPARALPPNAPPPPNMLRIKPRSP